MMNIYDNREMMCRGFTHFLLELTDNYPHLNLSLSGGNTPKVLFDYWAEHARTIIPWDKITFFWGDERCVEPEDEMSNYGMTCDHLFSKVPEISMGSIRRIYGENDPEAEAIRYSSVLERLLPLRNDLPGFDLILLGLGDDGHTVSIFPGEMEKWDDPKYCVVTQHPQTKMKRISITGSLINNARHVAFLVTGKEKAEMVERIAQQRQKWTTKYPAARVNPSHGQLHWFLDKEAASGLQPV